MFAQHRQAQICSFPTLQYTYIKSNCHGSYLETELLWKENCFWKQKARVQTQHQQFLPIRLQFVFLWYSSYPMFFGLVSLYSINKVFISFINYKYISLIYSGCCTEFLKEHFFNVTVLNTIVVRQALIIYYIIQL
jgi:hypothetical protein